MPGCALAGMLSHQPTLLMTIAPVPLPGAASYIAAGGVGLNIQAASVIIIAEPQLTPSIEEQAIARAHRMGQVRPVDVHRLLCEDSVDQRVLELLAGKREAFDEYARRSDMARATPDAVDTGSEAELRKAIVAAERTRLKAA